MSENETAYNWNGETIRFNDWHDQAYGEYEYLSRNGRYFFRFDLQPVGPHIRIFILEQPDYGGLSTDAHSTHRYYDSTCNQHYICIRNDLQPDNVPDALSWVVYWCEETSTYLDTGMPFS